MSAQLSLSKSEKTVRKELVRYFILIGFAVVLYAPVLIINYGFVWDDPWMLVNNPFVKSLEPENIWDILTSRYRGQYSPVNTLYYCLLFHFFGLNPFVFHLGNILIHIANSLLVYFFIKRLVERKGEIENGDRIIDVAFVCAFLFMITTVQVEAVAWVSASKVVLYSFFFLLSIIVYLEYQRNSKKLYYILSLLFFVVSIGSKEQAVILPVVLILVDYYTKGRIKIREQLDKTPFFIIAIVFGVISLQIQESGFDDRLTNYYFPFWQRLILAFYSVCQYVVKTLMPLRVSTFYEFPMEPGEGLKPIFLFFLLVGILIVYYLVVFRKYKELIWGAVFFLLNLSLSLHIIPLGRASLMADRYCYIPVIGIFFVCSFYFFDLLETREKYRNLFTGLGILYLAAIFIRSFLYVQAWEFIK